MLEHYWEENQGKFGTITHLSVEPLGETLSPWVRLDGEIESRPIADDVMEFVQ